ncbi:MAG: hypothetical protein WBF39_12865 [Planococcus donghaensis]
MAFQKLFSDRHDFFYKIIGFTKDKVNRPPDASVERTEPPLKRF